MHISLINNTNRNYNTNFGAKIVGNYYLRSEARYIAKKGTIEEKSRLLNYLNIIKNDKSFDTFEMKPDAKYAHKLPGVVRLCEYIFVLGKDEKVHKVYKDSPFINESLNWTGDGGDKHFILELGYFIKEHYGKDVHDVAYKNKPAYVQKYLDEFEAAQKAVQTQLKADIRDILDLEPLSYLMKGDGTKIPANRLAMPDNDYVC